MTSDQWRPDKRLPGWGLAFGVRDSGQYRRFGHGGSVFGGWNSFMGVFPELNSAFVLHINLMSDNFDSVFIPRLIAAFLGRDEPALPGRAVDPRVLETAPGVYELSMPGPLTNFRPQFNCGRVKISAEDGALLMYSRRGPWKSGARLLPVNNDPDFFAIDLDGYPRQHMTLLRDASGAVTGLRFPQIVDMYRNPELQPWV